MNDFETGINPDETKIEQYPTNLEEIAKELSEMRGCLIGKDQIERSQNLGELLEQKKEELVAKSNNFQELFEALDEINSLEEIDAGSGVITGTNKIYDIAEIKEIINKTRAGEYKTETGELDTSYITNTAGLRDKVIELLASE